MSISRDPLDTLVVPDGTSVREHDLVAEGDVLVGSRADLEFGIRGRNVVAGEAVEVAGTIEAERDCRLDMWCDVDGNVLVGEDAYLGERVHISGELKVAGDLDIGDDVDIEEGFEANGWIVIRNPMPTIVFLFVYLKHLLAAGEEEVAQRLIDEMTETSDEGDRPEEEPLLIPRNSSLSNGTWHVPTPATIGDDCRLHGNVRAQTVKVGQGNNIFGSVRARGDIEVGRGSKIHGDLTTRGGSVKLAENVRILGDVSCESLNLGVGVEVDGTIRADGEITMETTERDPE